MVNSDGNRKRPAVEGDSDNDKPPEPKLPKIADCDIKYLESSKTKEDVTDAPKDSISEGPISVETNIHVDTEKDGDEQPSEESH